jgi:hypothetical protein
MLPVMADGACWDDVLGTMPQETIAVRRAAFHQLLSGQPANIETVADEAGLGVGAAQEAANLVASVGMAEVNDGSIIGMDGLTTRPTRHGVVLNGVQLWTWCALRHRRHRSGTGGRGGRGHEVRGVRGTDQNRHPRGSA